MELLPFNTELIQFFALFCFCYLKATGVSVDDSVSDAFQQFKLKKGDYNLNYMTFKIKDKKNIVIDQMGGQDKSYQDFCECLPENEGRYGIVDISFETDDGRSTSKLVFISWNPDTSPIRSKMLYSGSKEAIKSTLAGVGIHINATDFSELDFESSILPTVKKFA